MSSVRGLNPQYVAYRQHWLEYHTVKCYFSKCIMTTCDHTIELVEEVVPESAGRGSGTTGASGTTGPIGGVRVVVRG